MKATSIGTQANQRPIQPAHGAGHLYAFIHSRLQDADREIAQGLAHNRSLQLYLGHQIVGHVANIQVHAKIIRDIASPVQARVLFSFSRVLDTFANGFGNWAA